jgi:mannose-6-phosphate isomerase-like protein (cupin superfamily)
MNTMMGVIMTSKDPREVRRIIAAGDTNGNAVIYEDKLATDVHTDPARPGFAFTRFWVTEDTPAPIKGVRETLQLSNILQPPIGGSVGSFVTIPPDAWYINGLTDEKVSDYFADMGAPEASCLGKGAPHPYMQQTRSLDYVLVLSGEVTMVLDMEEVHLDTGDTVINLGGSHAWSNRSSDPCELFLSTHDGRVN